MPIFGQENLGWRSEENYGDMYSLRVTNNSLNDLVGIKLGMVFF